MLQQYGLRDPILELIEKYAKKQNIGIGYGIDSKVNDHTHIFESDEPDLLKPIKLNWVRGRLDSVSLGKGSLQIKIKLNFSSSMLDRVDVTYPDGITVTYQLVRGDGVTEQKGRLIEIV